MMMLQILKFLDTWKAQKSEYLEDKLQFALEIKNSFIKY